MKFRKIKLIAKGWSSYIWKIKMKNGSICTLKEVREKSNRKNLAQREGQYLTLANSAKVGPKIIEINYKKNYVIYKFINGTTFLNWVFSSEFENATRKEIYNFIKELFRQVILLDSIGLRHTQLQVGKNILVTKKIAKSGKKEFVPTIIDFEKSSMDFDKRKEKNFGQIASFLFYNPNGAIAQKIREKLNLKL